MKELKRVLIMAGGTGGHIFPGLAVARYLREQGVEVHWLGAPQSLEARVVAETEIPLHLISIGGIRGKNLKTLLLAPYRIMKATAQAIGIMSRLKPNLVIGMGGYVSGPGGVASWLLRCPLVIHESNAKAGFTNQCLKYLSKIVLTGFPGVFSSRVKAVAVGNPVRAEIANLAPPAERFKGRTGKMRLLVFGGSLGAQAINEMMPAMLKKLPESERPEIIHQSGEKLYEATSEAYRQAGVQAKVLPFIKEMDQVYAWADVVVCRSGALTVAELCAAGLGSILIPFPFAVDDHQTANAQFLVEQGAAYLIQQRDLTEESLLKRLKELQDSPQNRLAMAEAAYSLRKIKVPQEIYELCLAL